MGGLKRKLQKVGHHIAKAQHHFNKIIPRDGRKVINNMVRRGGKAVGAAASKVADVYLPGAGAIVQKGADFATGKIEKKLGKAAVARQAKKNSLV